MSSEIVKLKKELAELHEYKDYHEFVASQLEEVLGEPIKNLGQVTERVRGLKEALIAVRDVQDLGDAAQAIIKKALEG